MATVYIDEYLSLYLFVYGTEDLHQRVCNEIIYNEALNKWNEYPDYTIDSEEGPMLLREYVNHINTLGFYEGELEIHITNQFNYINIATYTEDCNFRGYSIIRYFNNRPK